MEKIKIAHIYYDLMNLYGESGNIIALEKAFENQDMYTEIVKLSINDKIDFNKAFKWVVSAYALIIIVGIVFSLIFGVNLDINFSGGTKISYSYTGDIEEKDIEETVKSVIDKSFTVSRSTALAGDTQTFEIALVGKNSVSAENQQKLTAELEKKLLETN